MMNLFYFVLHFLILVHVGLCYQVITSSEQIPSHLQGRVFWADSGIKVISGVELDVITNGLAVAGFKVVFGSGCTNYELDFSNGRCTIKISSATVVVDSVEYYGIFDSSSVFKLSNNLITFGAQSATCNVMMNDVFKVRVTTGCSVTFLGISLVIPSPTTASEPTPSTTSSPLSTTITATESHLSNVTVTSPSQTSPASTSFSWDASSSANFSSIPLAQPVSFPSVAESGLSLGVIIAIVVAVCVCIVLPIIAGLVYYFIIRKHCQKSKTKTAMPKSRSVSKVVKSRDGERIKSLDTGLVSNVASKVAEPRKKTKETPSRFTVNLTGYGNTLLSDNPNEAIEGIIRKILGSCRLRTDAQKYDIFDGKHFENGDEFAAVIQEECRPLFIEYLNTRFEVQNREADEGTILTIVESLVTPEAVKKGIAEARQSAFGYETLGPIVEGLPSKVATAKPKEGPYHNMSEIKNNGQVFRAIETRKRRSAG